MEFQETGDREDRFIAAGINRMRPIAMTTFAAIPALLSLAMGIGEGSAMQDIADAAERIHAKAMRTRIPDPRVHDEIGRLVCVLNDTFDRLERSFTQAT